MQSGKVRSTFHTLYDYLNFYGEKIDDRLFTIYSTSKYVNRQKIKILPT